LGKYIYEEVISFYVEFNGIQYCDVVLEKSFSKQKN